MSYVLALPHRGIESRAELAIGSGVSGVARTRASRFWISEVTLPHQFAVVDNPRRGQGALLLSRESRYDSNGESRGRAPMVAIVRDITMSSQPDEGADASDIGRSAQR
jgi:hypothetical protein